MANNLFLTKGIVKRKGAVVDTVQGAVKVFLGKQYESDSPIKTGTFDVVNPNTGATIQRNYCNVRGQVKADSFIAKQMKYFFNQDIPEGDFLTFEISLWGPNADNFVKFNPKVNDLVTFFANSISVTTFPRRNGGTGISVSVQAFAFDMSRNAHGENGGKNSGSKQSAPKAPAAKQNTAPAAQPSYNAPDFDDFAAIEEADDLPF